MKYTGELVFDIKENKLLRKLVFEYREVLRRTDSLLNRGNKDWTIENEKANKLQDEILKVLDLASSDYFIAFPHSDAYAAVRPNSV